MIDSVQFPRPTNLPRRRVRMGLKTPRRAPSFVRMCCFPAGFVRVVCFYHLQRFVVDSSGRVLVAKQTHLSRPKPRPVKYDSIEQVNISIGIIYYSCNQEVCFV